jgi:hypothetical protein
MMNDLEFFIARGNAERPALLGVLKAIPKKDSAYRPDPKARTTADLAWLLAGEGRIRAESGN